MKKNEQQSWPFKKEKKKKMVPAVSRSPSAALHNKICFSAHSLEELALSEAVEGDREEPGRLHLCPFFPLLPSLAAVCPLKTKSTGAIFCDAASSNLLKPTLTPHRYILWVRCKMSLKGSCIWTLGPQLLLLGKPGGSGAGSLAGDCRFLGTGLKSESPHDFWSLRVRKHNVSRATLYRCGSRHGLRV